jgi:hypothetical protein
MRVRPTTVFLLSVISLAAQCFSQDYRGRIQGTVADSSQAALAGATIVLTNTSTSVSATQQTGPDGHYIFDRVEPGKYDLTVEHPGFQKFIQREVNVQTRGDVTVDATLRPGSVSETVSVMAAATTVEFNSSKLDTTVDTVIANRLPQLQRAPYFLAELDASVERNDDNPDNAVYSSWGPGQERIAGGANYSNDLRIDGSPTAISVKNGYQPAPDMIGEVNIVQNTVDAANGNGAGAAINLTVKSGSNSWHGLGYYQGQYPWANALQDRVTRTANDERKNIYGGNVGFPIFKGKLFNFVGYEGWQYTQPGQLVYTVPTTLEREGDFSQSLNSAGTTRWLYDPTSTDGSGNRMTFAAEAGHPGDPNYNKIPATLINPIAAYYTQNLWTPNQPVNVASNPTNANNYAVALPVQNPYKNFLDRVDYDVNRKLHLYGHVGLIRTPVSTSNPTGSVLFQSDRGSSRNGTQYAAGGTYMFTPKTVLDVRGDYHSLVDAAHFATNYASGGGWAKIWGGNLGTAPTTFYDTLFSDPSVPILIPRMSMLSYGNSDILDIGPGGGLWHQTPSGEAFSVQLSHDRDKHYLKTGIELIFSHSPSLLQNENPGFGFDPSPTSSTYLANDPTSGDPYATFLLGVVEAIPGLSDNSWGDGSTSMPVLTLQNTQSHTVALFVNDDWKVTRNVTLTLGLRYEYESAYSSAANNFARAPDLTAPNTVLQATGVGATLQSDVATGLGSAGYTGNLPAAPILNGAFQFTSSGHTGQWNAGPGSLSPRLGVAMRLNDKTSLRIGYGRYFIPWRDQTINGNQNNAEGSSGGLDMLSNPFYGYNQVSGAPSTLNQTVPGTPPMSLSNPFPGSFPIQVPTKMSDGVYTGLGDPNGIAFFTPNRPKSHSDRINISVQHAVARDMVFEAGYILNFSTQMFDTAYNLNQIDPRIGNTPAGIAAENTSVANPFYNLLPANQFPGSNALLPNVSLGSLMVPYPQYGPLLEYDGVRGGNMHYQAAEFKLTKNYSRGLSLLAGYSYHYEQDQRFFNSIDGYLQHWTWMQSPNARHRFVASGSYDLPFGKGRTFMASAPRGVDAVLGGWYISGVGTWRSGNYLQMPGAVVAPGSPVISNPGHNLWFNASQFSPLPAGAVRENPWFYPGLTGPHYFDMDASIAKNFHVTEGTSFQLRMDAFNVLNQFTWAYPDLSSPTSPTFGKSLDEQQDTYGRILQLSLRFSF